nr:PD40 domain-containing protein [Candidatus Nitrososphaera evergladensis]
MKDMGYNATNNKKSAIAAVSLSMLLVASIVVSTLGTLMIITMSSSAPQKASAAFPGKNGKIVFMSTRADGTQGISVIDADGTNERRLTNNTLDYSPRWSPDGKKIAFVSWRDGTGEIYVMNADGTNQTRLTNDYADNLSPNWSSDGKKIFFTKATHLSEGFLLGDLPLVTGIYVMNADGINQTRLTNSSAIVYWPKLSPDATKIVGTAKKDGDVLYELYVTDIYGSHPTRLTTNSLHNYSPNWSPDGKKIVFISTRDGAQARVCVTDIDGTHQKRLTAVNNNFSKTDNDVDPSWSPDGKKIVYSNNKDDGNRFQIYIMDADGTHQKRLTRNGNDDVQADFGPVEQ